MGKIIKRILIIVGVVILVLIVGLFAMCAIADKRNKNYWKYVESNKPIEKKYIALGDKEVSEYSRSDSKYGKMEIWYPSDMKDSSAKYPLVIMANGTGIKASAYTEVFKHLASWGFVVAGNEDENSRSGASSEATLNYVLQLNAESGNIFYGKIDTDNIGIAGHSQGGVGALNAVTEQPSGNKYKAIWTASATSRYHAIGLNNDSDDDKTWNCYPSKISIPCFMVAGTGNMDAGNMDKYTESLEKGEAQGICPKWWLDECYDAITANTKMVARRKDKDHGDMLRWADGYMTAWFMYHLKGDTSADFFSGSNAEILSNKNWQDVTKSI